MCEGCERGQSFEGHEDMENGLGGVSGSPGGLGLGAEGQTECGAPVRWLPQWSGQKTEADGPGW